MLNRRKLLIGLGSGFLFAPAVVSASSLMKIKPLIRPPSMHIINTISRLEDGRLSFTAKYNFDGKEYSTFMVEIAHGQLVSYSPVTYMPDPQLEKAFSDQRLKHIRQVIDWPNE